MNFSEQSVAQRKTPAFLYVGAAKAASSWLYEMLREHPQVFVPMAKDIQFFDHHYDLGMDWYLSHFAKATENQVAGEISHDYFLSGTYATRIKQSFPNIKILACLREPLDRTISMYTYGRSVFVNKNIPLDEFAFWPDTLKGSDYYHNLKPFYENFPEENIKVLFFDNLKSNPLSFAREVFEFIGVDAGFTPPSHNRPARVSRVARHEWLGHMAWGTAKILRRLGFANTVGAVKRHPIFNHLVFRTNVRKPEFSNATRNKLHAYFSKDYKALSDIIGHDLPLTWNL